MAGALNQAPTRAMIVQGDTDYEMLQQGEQFFAGLYRQNKRASFVRYLGEGHVLQGLSNTRDMLSLPKTRSGLMWAVNNVRLTVNVRLHF
jgi:hypothetical protein